MCHAESPCIICSCIILILFHLSDVSSIKFNQQSLHVKNAKGALVATIPVEGIVSKKRSTTPENNENLTVLWFKGDGCDLAELQKSSVKIQNGAHVKSIVILNTLNCDLATKIAHSHLLQISAVLFHNLATNDNPSSVVLEASDIISKNYPILVFFIGYAHGHLILDKFMSPNQFFVTVHPVEEKVFVTTDENLLNGKERRKRKKSPQNTNRGPGPSYATFASLVYPETEFEAFLQENLDFPPMAAFFGGMVLWICQVGVLLALIFAASFLVISIMFGLIYYYPLKFFRREGSRSLSLESGPESALESDEFPEEFLNEHILIRLREMYEFMDTDEQFATARVPEEKIASLHKTILNESEATRLGVCGICEEVHQAGIEVTRLLPSCTHLFHTLCIEPWLRMASSCPLCRKIVNGNLESDEIFGTNAEYEVVQ